MTPSSSTTTHEPPVLDWGRVIHKGVRTKDGEPVGNIAAEDQDFLIILGPRFREYNVPKSVVEAFDGSEIRLSISQIELDRYKI